MSLSVAIITLNEEANLPRTMASVRWASEIIVLDSGSSDRTVEIAESLGAKVFHQDWLGFGAQKNAALAKCTGDWLLSLDADEELSPEAQQEIQEITLDRGDIVPDAYLLSRRNFFLGRWLKHGGMYPDAKPRLLRRSLFVSGAARFAERLVHEDIECSVPTAMLRGDSLHHAYPTITGYVEHLRRYAELAAEMLHEAEQRRSKPHSALWFATQTVLNPYLTFIYNYVLRGGFLDGRRGFIYHAYHSCYISWKYSKAWQLRNS